ncbi:hypothetical protein UZ36_01620 [Candidatus Nitromaritima sp. SCGC AAA799-C22]|nr:hypothetical protein UZ36_01620 [Candidatus Nitromaritima sp. SCGC AAA799-C22]
MAGPHANEEALKKKKLWRNLFLLNLCITILLIGLFWLPVKFVQMESFINSPSVNLPKKGEAVGNVPAVPVEQAIPSNLLETRLATINASSEDNWVYFDFSRGEVVKIHDPTSLEWDLAFRRSKVISNGGATNKFGKAGLIDMGSMDFDMIAEVPLNNYVQDIATRTETENPILLKWYRYNYLTHKLTPKPNTYAIRTADSKFAKIKFLNFYCANKETGCIQMQYVFQESGSNQFTKSAVG